MSSYVNNLDQNASELLTKWNLQGFSIGIVKDGKVILSKGYGLRNEKDCVDEYTLMPIGSATKSFTALILGMLKDEGKVDWDTPVIEYIPSLRLYDEYVTTHVTLRDLLSHVTGAAAYDAQSIYPVPEVRSEIIPMLEYLKPEYEFRKGFKYSNQMVTLAGCVAEAVSGRSWEELVTERILKPLGMDNTLVSMKQMKEHENRSLGYIAAPQGNLAQPYLDLKAVGPAGAIISCSADMVKYLCFQLSDGTWNGERLIEKATLDEMHQPQANGSPYLFALDEITETKYGLGWFTDLYRGKPMYSHGGNTLGFSALMTCLPSEDLGVIVLSNGTTNFLCNAITYQILDDYMGVEQKDWTDALNAVLGPLFAAMAAGAQAKADARAADTKFSLAVEEYAGSYESEGFGTINIVCKDSQLLLEWNGYQGMLTHYHYDVFDLVMFVYGVSFPLTFKINDGVIEGFEAPIEPNPAVPPVFFRRK